MRRAASIVALVAGLASCARGGRPAADAGARGPLLVRVGEVELREQDLARAMARDPGFSQFAGATQDPGARRDMVEGLVRFELLAQAAEKAGLTQDPDAIHAMRQIAVTKFVNRELGAAASPDSITKQDLEREYEARRATEFTRPEAAHVRHLRVADAAHAARLAAAARALDPADERGFAALAARESNHASTRATGGDLGFVDPGSRLPRALRDAALRLRNPGEVIGPLATDQGYEVVRLVARRPAAVSPLAEVEEQLRQRMYRERRARALEALIAGLRAATPVVPVAER